MTVDVLLGLDEVEAGRRLARFGSNALAPPRSRRVGGIVATPFRESMLLLLLAASVLYLMLGGRARGAPLTAAAVATIGPVFFQESLSERALVALRGRAEPHARISSHAL